MDREKSMDRIDKGGRLNSKRFVNTDVDFERKPTQPREEMAGRTGTLLNESANQR